MESFKPLFEIHLYHQYYDGGMMKEIKLLPDEKTQAWIDRYRLLLRQQEGLLTLYYVAEQDEESFFETLSRQMGEEPFGFAMLSDNPYFAVVSDLPVDWKGQLKFSTQALTGDEEIPVMTMQLSNQELWKSGTIGFIELYPVDLFEKKHDQTKRCYQIKIEARKTHWVYYVFNRSRLKLHNPMITNDQGIQFEEAEKVTMPDGEEALKFTSGEMQFPFQETPTIKLNFVSFPAQGSQARALRKGLPAPRGTRIAIEEQEGKQIVYSDIYVYI